jgi:hypothetical protein
MSAAVATSSFAVDEALEEESSVLDADDALELADDEALLDALSSAEEDEDDAESPAIEAQLDVDAVAASSVTAFDAESSSAEAGNTCRQNRQTSRGTSARTNAPPMRCSCVTSMPRPPNPLHAGSMGLASQGASHRRLVLAPACGAGDRLHRAIRQWGKRS